jgi:hypothetical protein
MKPRFQKTIACLLLALCLAGLTACSSTRTENGVTIENKGGLNPFNYLRGL